MPENRPQRGDCHCKDDAPPNIICCCIVSVAAPLECSPCARSKSSDHIYAEMPVRGDWEGRGFVMRVGCLCDACMSDDLEKDDTRTEFETFAMAVAYWNVKQAEIEYDLLQEAANA